MAAIDMICTFPRRRKRCSLFSLLVERLRDYRNRCAVYRGSGAELSALLNREVADWAFITPRCPHDDRYVSVA